MNAKKIRHILKARTEAKEHEARLYDLLKTDLSDHEFSSYQLQASMYAGQRIAYEHTLNILEVDFE